MNAHLNTIKLPANSLPNNIFFADTNKMATTDKEGTVRIFSRSEEEDEASLIQEYKNHTGLVTDLAFAPITHGNFILTCGYDRSVYLNQDGKLVFSYTESDTETGYFTSCCFMRTSGNVLSFLVGSSNGYVIEFSSLNSFKPVKTKILESSVVSLESSKNDSYLVCGDSTAPQLCQVGEEPMELPTDLTKNKLKLALSQEREENECLVLLADELGNLEILKVNTNERTVNSEFMLQLPDKLLNASWNFSGLSANLVIEASESGSDFKVMRLQYDFEEKREWTLVETDNQTIA